MEYTILQNIFNIEDGTNIGDTFCAGIRLAMDNALEETERFFVSLANAAAVQVPDTDLTVTIIDGDGMLCMDLLHWINTSMMMHYLYLLQSNDIKT